MRRLLLLALFPPTTLLAQREPGRRPEPFYEDTAVGPGASRAWSLGIVGYTGGLWQPSGIEASLLWRLGERAATGVGVSLTLGSFTQNQAVYIGRTQGFFAAIGLSLRQPLLTLAEVGSERNPAYVRLETALDAGWSADFNSPLPQGPSDFRAAALVGFSFGSPTAMGQSVAILFGPSALMGRSTTTHGELALRFRMPVH